MREHLTDHALRVTRSIVRLSSLGDSFTAILWDLPIISMCSINATSVKNLTLREIRSAEPQMMRKMMRMRRKLQSSFCALRAARIILKRAKSTDENGYSTSADSVVDRLRSFVGTTRTFVLNVTNRELGRVW